jgi:hypothetical protein
MKDIIVSTDPVLNQAFQELELILANKAMENLQEARESRHYTGPQLLSMLRFEQLRLVNGMDIAAVLLRGKLLKEIEEKRLWTTHPELFPTLEDAATYYKIPKSLLSNIRDWYNIIFPYFHENNIDPAEIIENIGLSNFREITPVLKSIITDTESSRELTKASVEKVKNDIAATERVSGNVLTEDEKKLEAIHWAITAGHATNQELRKNLRPKPPIEATLISSKTTKFVIAEITDEQTELLTNTLGKHFDFTYLTLEEANPKRVPILKKILGG